MIEKKDYYYFVHRTSAENYQSFFQNGIILYDPSYTIQSTLEKVEESVIQSGNLDSFIKNCVAGDSYNKVFLVKIPKAYFDGIRTKTGRIYQPIPFLDERECMGLEVLAKRFYPVIIPCLIQGCYSREKGYITNPNFSPVFNPDGLKFSKEQIYNLQCCNMLAKSEECLLRNEKYRCDFLREFDKRNGTWNPFVKYFSELFGRKAVNPFPNSPQQR